MVIRRRLIFWLIKAYIKKSGKMLIASFVLGLIIFFAIIFGSQYVTTLLPNYKKASVGVVGAYTQENLPTLITNNFSRGLTKIAPDGSIQPDLAKKWEIQDGGKKYVFHLKENEYFSTGENVTSSDIIYNFSDVTTTRPDKYTIVFTLKDVYAPFLVTVSRGVFEKGAVGVGNYKIENINLNGNFVQSLTIVSVKNRFDKIRYQFYPSEEALKLAYLLGEVTEASDLTNPLYKEIEFTEFPNTKVNKVTNDSQLVTLFYNTTDSTLSDKKLRIALEYALPSSYPYGEKTYLPYSSKSLYYNSDVVERKQDYDHAKLLLADSGSASGSAGTVSEVTIKTLKKYRQTADLIAASWKNIGIKTSIEEVERLPDTFQVFLGDFTIPPDPDQYTLWHSGQVNNITNYKNLRIDKLLEDGRKTTDVAKRGEIYADFQRFLIEDAPASFLYFPYEYDLVRK